MSQRSDDVSGDAQPSRDGPSDNWDERYFRKGLGLRADARDEVTSEYRSDWVHTFKESGYRIRVGDESRSVSFSLAREFGFCYGVERSVDYAYETLMRFPGRRIILTGEIIHNPSVNRRLRDLGICFMGEGDLVDASSIGPEDVVILPAFGVATNPFDEIRASGAVVVDTTCGSVLNVWKNVERYARDGLTSLVHGKVNHEETRATVSRTSLYEDAHYIVVLDMDDATLVADVIRGDKPAASILERFPHPHTSRGFDPHVHLARIGVANQTTMLSSESLAIARTIGAALEARYGDRSEPGRFRSFDTICSATQDRQDALRELICEPLDVLLVIGGHNSSNTGHLAELADGVVPAFHIESAADLLGVDTIRHKPVGTKSVLTTENWLPSQPPHLVVGLTAGASTPDAAVGATVERVLDLCGITIPQPT